MRDSSRLSALIGDIYDAAQMPERWTQVLSDVCSYVGGAAAMIFQHDSLFLEGTRLRSWGDNPHYTDLYFSQYIDLNPSSRVQGEIPEGRAVSISGLVGAETLHASKFYREWMEPQGYVDNVFANLHRSSTRSAAIAVARGRRNGLVTPAALLRMQNLVSHVQRAVHIGSLIDRGRADAVVLQKLVEGLSASVFLINAGGQISRVNTMDQQPEADRGLVWRAVDGQYRMDRRLEPELAAFSHKMATSGALQDRRHAFALADQDQAEWLVHLHWLRPEGSVAEVLSDSAPVVAVFVHRAVFNAEAALDLVTRRYLLTPREKDIIRSMVGASGMAHVAEREGITTRTAKAHLHSVFAKTGTARQADLIKLLASYASPL